MPSVLDITRQAYHLLVPRPIRRMPLVDRFAYWIVLRLATHNELYDDAYYADVENLVATSAPIVAQSIAAEFPVTRVVDVGCGTGALLDAFRSLGCECFGFEYSDAALEVCRRRGLTVRPFDLEKDDLESAFPVSDVATSTEVAEHLPEKCADKFVALLTRLSKNVVLTAAPPGQGGVDHVNEQPNEYWIAKFAARHFLLDRRRTEMFRADWKVRGVASFYYRNVMVFTRVETNGAGRAPVVT